MSTGADDAEIDQPMDIGSHLHELRARLVRVLLVLSLITIASFAVQVPLQHWVQWPLVRAIEWTPDETLQSLGLEIDRDDIAGSVRLTGLNLFDGPSNVVKLSLFAALAVAFPYLLYQIWAFVRPGLRRNEARAGFLLMPAAVIFFYAGLAFGYLFGVPMFLKMMMDFSAAMSTIQFPFLQQADYYALFLALCLVFGAIMDIPWLILVLVRAGLVEPDALARKRKVIVVSAALLAAIFSPPDPFSQLLLLGMVVILFESGLAASRVMYRRQLRAAQAAAGGRPRDRRDGLIGHMIDLPGDERPSEPPVGAARPAPNREAEPSEAVDEDETDEEVIDAGDDADAFAPAEDEPADKQVDPDDPWLHGGRRRKFPLPPPEPSGPTVVEPGIDAGNQLADEADSPWNQGRPRGDEAADENDPSEEDER